MSHHPPTNELINSNMLRNLVCSSIRFLCLLVFVFNCYVCFNFKIIKYTISCSFLEPRYWRTISVWKFQSFVTIVLYIDLLQWQTCKITGSRCIQDISDRRKGRTYYSWFLGDFINSCFKDL